MTTIHLNHKNKKVSRRFITDIKDEITMLETTKEGLMTRNMDIEYVERLIHDLQSVLQDLGV